MGSYLYREVPPPPPTPESHPGCDDLRRFQDTPQEDLHIPVTILVIILRVKLPRQQNAQSLLNGHLGPSGHKHLEPLGKPRELGLDQAEELILLVVLRFVEGVDDEHLAAFRPRNRVEWRRNLVERLDQETVEEFGGGESVQLIFSQLRLLVL